MGRPGSIPGAPIINPLACDDSQMSDDSSLEGTRFRVAAMGEQGEASAETVFEYHQDGDLIWATYEGGAVRLGFLVGTRDADKLDFRYSQLNESGETASGHCSTTISVLPDGRLRLNESWVWESKPGSGVSAVEELL